MASGAQRIKNGPASYGHWVFQRLISTLRACSNRSRVRAGRASGAYAVRASVQRLWRLRAVHGSGGGGMRGHIPAFARDRACRRARGGALPVGRTRGNDIASAGRFGLGSAAGLPAPLAKPDRGDPKVVYAEPGSPRLSGWVGQRDPAGTGGIPCMDFPPRYIVRHGSPLRLTGRWGRTAAGGPAADAWTF